MNKAEFTDLIVNPDKLGSEHIDTLKKIVADYPYFSAAQILLTKALLNTNHYEYDKQLKTTALHVGDRTILHQFLHNQMNEVVDENSLMRVPDELKAEKVSRPDFEIGKEEQEALLQEAQNIISNHENGSEETILENIVKENTPEPIIFEEKITEITADNFDFTEPILENIAEEVTPESVNFEEKIAEITADNFDFTEPILENIVNEIPSDKTVFETSGNENTTEMLYAVDIDFSIPNLTDNEEAIPAIETNSQNNFINENVVDNITEESTETNFQLSETEGTLVRFVNPETFLPNFDESSLFADEISIETITKSVLPNNIIQNSTPIIEPEIPKDLAFQNIEEEKNFVAEINEITSENSIENKEIIEQPIEEIPQDIVIENNVDDITQAEEPIPNFWETKNITSSEIVTLENLLENTFEVNQLTESVTNVPETIAEENIENIVAHIIEKETISDDNHLNFFEWLSKNKSNINVLTSEISNTTTIKNDEYDVFVEKIKQLIKSKAEFELNQRIAFEIKKADETIVEQKIKVVTIEDLIETVEKIETEDNLLADSIVEIKSDEEDLTTPFDHFKPEFYTGIVDSILPDFELLKTIPKEEPYLKFDKIDGLIPNYETPPFDPLFNNDKQISKSDLNHEEIITDSIDFESFEAIPIDNNLFDQSFNAVFEPLAIENNSIEKAPEIDITENKIKEGSKTEIDNILEKFMRENPSISRPKTEFFNPANVAKISVEEKNEIVSETLATIYLKQGLIKKAILTYEKLCLIYPHKNAYFAALINQLKTEHNIN